jgi:hypothetical protein
VHTNKHHHYPVTIPISFSTTSTLQATAATSASAGAAAVGANAGGITERDAAIQQLLQRARELGPIGTDCTSAQQDELVTMARKVAQYSDAKPARVLLPPNSVHHLVYSASPGGSSGKILGPVVGKVTQTILDERDMVNAVECGSLCIALELHREILDDTTTRVTFDKTSTFLFGRTVTEKLIANRSGIWNIHFVGNIIDVDGRRKLVRVMETPSLFILVSPL